uniref:HTH cro/C1-type domain-containing protein n=1 Tax=Astatotilapia calliptera TaxID=8154 RepID=A0AAX7TWB0_ASTCA
KSGLKCHISVCDCLFYLEKSEILFVFRFSLCAKAITSAQRRGEEVQTSKKWAAGQNKQHLVTKNTAKLDRETEELHHDRVPLEVGKVIQQGRQEKGLTQKDLATKINEKPQIIADYECGRAIPNNQVMGKIERAIGLKLRGKDIGQPLEPKTKKK